MSFHLADVFEALSDALPDAACMVQGERSVSWRQFDEEASRLAFALHAAGVKPHDKVGIYLTNCPEWVVTFFAAIKIRAVPVTINYRYVDDELGYILDDCEAAAVVYHSGFADRMAKVAAPRRDRLRLLVQVNDGAGYVPVDDLVRYEDIQRDCPQRAREPREVTDSLFIYTGGTTGMPKGVSAPVAGMGMGMLMGPVAMNMLGLERPPGEDYVDFALELRQRGEARVSCPVAPLMHGVGLNLGALPALCTGSTIAFLTRPSFDPETLARAIEKHRITSAVIAGDAMARPLTHYLGEARAKGVEFDLSSLAIIVTGGVALTPAGQESLFEFMPDVVIIDQAGSTEGGLGHRRITRHNFRDNPGFIPFPGVRVLRPDDTDVEPGSGERGLLACPSKSDGYYKDTKKTTQVFREIDGVRYALAGDWASVNGDGTITLIGRDASVINTGGEKVFPEEVEDLICLVPGVADCLVVGTPDERFGQAVTAVVSLHDSALTEREIAAGLRDRIAGYKIPRRFVFVEKVPRLLTGKADRAMATELALKHLEAISG